MQEETELKTTTVVADDHSYDVDALPKTQKCQVCSINPFKYTCPCCACKTCSVGCVKEHKSSNQCDGNPPVAKFLAVSEMDNLTLLADYRFLEDAGRVAEKVSKLPSDNLHQLSATNTSNKFDRDKIRKNLWQAAKKQHILFEFQPEGMTKSLKNRSRFEFFADSIIWSVQLTVMSKENSVSVVVHNIADSLTLSTLLKQLFNPKKLQKLSVDDDAVETELLIPPAVKLSYANSGLDDIDAFLVPGRVHLKSVDPKDRKLYSIDKSSSLRKNLTGKSVTEFPEIVIAVHEEIKELNLVAFTEGEERENHKAIGEIINKQAPTGRGRGQQQNNRRKIDSMRTSGRPTKRQGQKLKGSDRASKRARKTQGARRGTAFEHSQEHFVPQQGQLRFVHPRLPLMRGAFRGRIRPMRGFARFPMMGGGRGPRPGFLIPAMSRVAAVAGAACFQRPPLAHPNPVHEFDCFLVKDSERAKQAEKLNSHEVTSVTPNVKKPKQRKGYLDVLGSDFSDLDSD